MKNNLTLVNLQRALFATLHYVAYQPGIKYVRDELPSTPTVNGTPIDVDEKVFGTDKLLYDIAKQRGLLDQWIPELTLELGHNRKLIYTGSTALKLWGKWKGIVYGKRKTKPAIVHML